MGLILETRSSPIFRICSLLKAECDLMSTSKAYTLDLPSHDGTASPSARKHQVNSDALSKELDPRPNKHHVYMMRHQ